ncbi:hypothetical protein Bca101_075533 [Brassica carinata]
MFGFFSGVDAFDSVVWPAYVLVSHLPSGRFSSELYRILLGLLLFVPSLFQLIPASIGSTTTFDWNSFIGRGVRLGYSCMAS